MKAWTDQMKEDWIKYIISILIAAIGFFIVTQMQSTNTHLAEISKEILAVKMEIVHIQNTMITEERVKELIKLELLKRDQK